MTVLYPVKIQGYVELINYQQTKIVNLENTRVYVINVFKCRHPYIRGKMKKAILKRVIVIGATGSSWSFQSFNKLQIIVTDELNFKNEMSG